MNPEQNMTTEKKLNNKTAKTGAGLFWRGLAAGITVGTGIFLLLKEWDFSDAVTFGIGVLALLIGFVIASLPTRSWLAVFGVIAFGFYQMAKAAGIIDGDLLRYIVAIPLILLGMYSFFMMMPPKEPKRGA